MLQVLKNFPICTISSSTILFISEEWVSTSTFKIGAIWVCYIVPYCFCNKTLGFESNILFWVYLNFAISYFILCNFVFRMQNLDGWVSIFFIVLDILIFRFSLLSRNYNNHGFQQLVICLNCNVFFPFTAYFAVRNCFFFFKKIFQSFPSPFRRQNLQTLASLLPKITEST